MLFDDYERLVFFDTETTGFDANKNQIIELAAISIEPNGRSIRMDDFIRLPEGEHIPDEIVKLTGITDEMLEEKGFSETMIIEKFIYGLIAPGQKRTLLIAHNASFDLNFVRNAILRQPNEQSRDNMLDVFDEADYLDTMTVYKDRRAYPHKLEDAIKAYGLEDKVHNSHRAIDDVLALCAVTKAMALERDDLDKYVNVFGYNPKYGFDKDRLMKVFYLPQPFRKEMASAEEILIYT